MPTSFLDFFNQLEENPALALTALLTLGVLLVNGWTDAPNAIAGAVITGALPFRKAVLLAAVCNFLGVLCVTAAEPAVAETVYSIASFEGGSKAASLALCAAMAAVVLWAAAAWRWGIPTSESHALVAGLSGAAVALEGSLSCIHWQRWGAVLLGLVLSTALGFGAGRWAERLTRGWECSPRTFRRLQIPGAAGSAFLHGAQDGQKFLGVFLLGTALTQGRQEGAAIPIPLWLVTLCAFFMALGTGMGGKRIIDTVGRDMVALGVREGFSADLAGILCLLAATLLGLPVSTTHTRTAALLGVGSAGGRPVRWPVVRSIGVAWLCTFPGCMGLGYGLTRLALGLWGLEG